MYIRHGLGMLMLIVAGGVAVWADPPAPVKGKKSGVKGDLEMVERLLTGRKEYQSTLEALRAYYIGIGDIERARWAEE